MQPHSQRKLTLKLIALVFQILLLCIFSKSFKNITQFPEFFMMETISESAAKCSSSVKSNLFIYFIYYLTSIFRIETNLDRQIKKT